MRDVRNRRTLIGPICALFFLCDELSAQELLAASRDFPGLPDALAVGPKDLSIHAVQREEDAGIAHPLNVSGTYKGAWQKWRYDGGVLGSKWLQKEEGLIIYQLKATPTSVDGVHNIEGEIVLRDGVYVTEDDAVLRVEGVYVVATGRVHALARPAAPPLRAPLQPGEAEANTADYRKALRNRAARLVAGPRRRSASLFALENDEGGESAKECEFVMDVAARAAEANATGNDAALWRRRSLLAGDVSPEEAEARKDAPQPRDAFMNGTVASEGCRIVLALTAATTHLEVYFAKAVNYTLMITAVSFVQILLLIRQMEATATQAAASKVSLLTLGHQSIMDAYLCLLHLTTGIMVEPLFNAFATTAFFEFVTFAIFEMRYLLAVWRARRASALEPWAAQRELSLLYMRFYGALLAGIFATYQLQRWIKAVTFALYGFWVPQIVFCARHDARQPLRAEYVLGMAVSRLALPVYLHLCPHNLLRMPPSPGFAATLAAFMAAQVAVLLTQTRWGPRWFIPKALLPAKYDYFRACPIQPATPRALRHAGLGGGVVGSANPIGPGQGAAEQGPGSGPTRDVETGDGGVECVICMNPVDVDALSQRMVTPCAHFFHTGCLNRWMDVKMECPTCRRSLPPP